VTKVRHSSRQVLNLVRDLQAVATKVAAAGPVPKVGLVRMDYRVEYVADQDFAKEIENRLGAGADAPAIEGLVDVHAEGGLGVGTGLEQDSNLKVVIKGAGSNHSVYPT
jgi:hypothetical protein